MNENSTPSPFPQGLLDALIDQLVTAGAEPVRATKVVMGLAMLAFNKGRDHEVATRRAYEAQRKSRQRSSKKQLVDNASPETASVAGHADVAGQMSRDTLHVAGHDMSRDTLHVAGQMSRDTPDVAGHRVAGRGGTIGGGPSQWQGDTRVEGNTITRGNQLADSAIPENRDADTGQTGSTSEPDPPPEVDTRSPIEKFPILTDPVFLGLADDEVEL